MVGAGRESESKSLALNPNSLFVYEPYRLGRFLQRDSHLMQDLHANGIYLHFYNHDLSVVKHISDEILVMYWIMVEKTKAKTLFQASIFLTQSAFVCYSPNDNSHPK